MNSDLMTIGIVCKTSSENPWLERLLASIELIPSGLGCLPEIIIEEGAQFTKVEKKIRVFRNCKTPYLLMMEDDTELVTPGYANAFLNSVVALPGVAIVGPAEVGFGITQEQAAPQLIHSVQDATNLGGFCMFLDTRFGICWDARVQTIDDLQLCLAARIQGRRVLRCLATAVRHTKEPWLRDGIPAWEQGDRRRYDEEQYGKESHQKKRLAECRLLLDWYGDLARQSVPMELMAILEPQRVPVDGVTQIAPGCTDCHKSLTMQDSYVMFQSSYPLCVDCFLKRRT